MTRNGFLVIALAASLAGACSRNPGNETASNAKNPPAGAVGTAGKPDNERVTRGDKDFVHDVALANAAEIELGKMAAERAADPEVKKYGQMMVDDHTPSGERLKALATENGIDCPEQLEGKFADKRDDLAKKQGAEFDRGYMALMAEAHDELVNKLESRIDKKDLPQWKAETDDRAAGKPASDRSNAAAIVPEHSDDAVTMRINEWAAKVYPVAYAHLTKAKTLESAIKRRQTNP